MAYLERDDVKLYYRQAGSGDSKLVFIHGWCCDHTFFQPQFDHFRSTHGVTTLDLRGCGESDRPKSGYDMATFADDVAWLSEELALDRPVVVGHSMGGGIAIELAARYPTLPAAVVAVDPGPLHPTPETRSLFEGFAARMEGPDGEAVRRAWVASGPFDDPELERRVVETMCSVPLQVAVPMLRDTTITWNGVAALLLCHVPMLVIRAAVGGSNDPTRLKALKPDLHVGVTVGAGHFHQLEVPAQVNAMIERFVQIAVAAPGHEGD
jgi:pimeloyl-ACP methyl ester carboxylesterase